MRSFTIYLGQQSVVLISMKDVQAVANQKLLDALNEAVTGAVSAGAAIARCKLE